MLFTLAYGICFSVLLVGAFTLMSQILRPGSPRVGRSRHPEAPQPGERLLYVDLNRERLEALYQQPS